MWCCRVRLPEASLLLGRHRGGTVWGESREGRGTPGSAEPGRCPRTRGQLSCCHRRGWPCRLCPAPPPPPHLNSSENLLEGRRLVSPGGQQLSSSLKVLHVLTVHLQEGGEFLDHVTDAGGGCPAGGVPRYCPWPEGLLLIPGREGLGQPP